MSARVPTPRRAGRHAWWVVAGVFVLAAGTAVWIIWASATLAPVVEDHPDELRPRVSKGWFDPPPNPDQDAATAHNTRGVELMDELEFSDARREFAVAVRAAPDWLPARINYGIALFNQQPSDTKALAVQVQKARLVFAGVLARDPDNKHAHYCLGMIDLYVADVRRAFPHFQRVSELDPNDAHIWLRLGYTHPDGEESAAAGECYEKAIALDPNLFEARYRLARVLLLKDEKRADELLVECERLRDTDQATESRIVFGEMGKYADVIGRDPTRPGEYGGDPPKRRKRG